MLNLKNLSPFPTSKPSPKKTKMSNTEVITIIMLFQWREFRTFKHFCIYNIQKHMKNEFPQTISYNRLAELMPSNLIALTMLAQTCTLENYVDISFMDRTPIKAYGNKSIQHNQVFKALVITEKSIISWFRRFSLHIVINDKGEIFNFDLHRQM